MKRIVFILLALLVCSATYAQTRLYPDKQTGEYITESEFINKYGKEEFRSLNNQFRETKPSREYSLKLNSTNLIIGVTSIGVSLSAYAISNSLISDKIESLDLNDDYEKKLKSLNNTKNTVGYICGGVSLAGVIVILTGIQKEYKPNLGFNLKGNTYLDSNNGVSLAISF